jgi:hypothetical protein
MSIRQEQPVVYGFLADVVEGTHLAFLVFTVVGQLLILVGWACGWQWIRNPWFRSVHALAIVFVAWEYVVGMECPLTDLEKCLRNLAGETRSDDWSFMGWLISEVIFYPNLDPDDLKWPYIGFAVLVVATFVLVPPRFRKAGPKLPAGEKS